MAVIVIQCYYILHDFCQLYKVFAQTENEGFGRLNTQEYLYIIQFLIINVNFAFLTKMIKSNKIDLKLEW